MGKWSEAQKRYQNSDKGRAAKARYMAKRKARLAEAKQTEEIKPLENKVEAIKIKKEVASKK